MLGKVKTCAVQGLDGYIVEVEVDISPGLPCFNIVGLPDTAVQEAKERVRAAIRNSGCEFPMRRIAVNLAPADTRKAGPSYDLPIALGILMSSGQLPETADSSLFLGELSLDGSLKHTSGILSMTSAAREQGFSNIYVPSPDANEAALLNNISVLPTNNLGQLLSHLKDGESIVPHPGSKPIMDQGDASSCATDLSHIKGQEHAKRALEVAASGGHNLMLTGPPGSGKTLLARSMATILPKMTLEEALEVTKIYSIAGLLPPDKPLMQHRPFRAPHYTISNAGLVGGGRLPRPGEITLSHRGILFLDELPEFGHPALESLRQPLEDKTVTISRVGGTITYPANFSLVSAMNPCPCGFLSHPVRPCVCSSHMVSRYQKRISGPLMDRIDIFIEAPPVEYEKLVDSGEGETSEQVQLRVEAARTLQLERFLNTTYLSNSDIGPADIWRFCPSEEKAKALLQKAMNQLNLSARAFHKMLKLSRTIADLAGVEIITVEHVAEALQYRHRSMA